MPQPHPETTAHSISRSLDSDPPPPSYDYAVKMDQEKNQTIPEPPPQANVTSSHHHHHHYHQNLTPNYEEPNQSGIKYLDPQYYQHEITNCRKHEQDPSNMKNMVLLYIMGFLDMITAAILLTSMSMKRIHPTKLNQNLTEIDEQKNLNNTGNELEMHDLEYGMVLVSRIIQFLMGLILIIALRTPTDKSKIICFQLWICAAFLLMFRDAILCFGILFNFTSESKSIKWRFGLFVKIYGIIFRLFWAYVMKKYIKYLRARLEFRNRLLEATQDLEVVKDMMQRYAAPGKVCPFQNKNGENPQNSPEMCNR